DWTWERRTRRSRARPCRLGGPRRGRSALAKCAHPVAFCVRPCGGGMASGKHNGPERRKSKRRGKDRRKPFARRKWTERRRAFGRTSTERREATDRRTLKPRRAGDDRRSGNDRRSD